MKTTLQDNIDIMQALSNGVIIEVKFRTGMEWEEIHNSRWKEFNFANFDYRIKPEEIPKPEPTLLERIEAAYEGKEVVMLEWSNSGYLLYTDEDCDQRRPHIEAQSMKGFDGFIYDWKDIDNDLPFTKIFPPVRLGCHPIAAVFNK